MFIANSINASPPKGSFWQLTTLAHLLETERGRWFLWVPVSFGLGILWYFLLGSEPSWFMTSAFVLAGLTAMFITSAYGSKRFVIGFTLSSICIWAAFGFAIAKTHTFVLQHPVITYKTPALNVQGWVTHVQQKSKKQARVIVRVHAISQDNTQKKKARYKNYTAPKYVRLRVNTAKNKIQTGDYLTFKAILYPLPQPVLPGGFNYAQKLWFEEIGGLGFTIAPPEHVKNSPVPPLHIVFKATINKMRSKIAEHIRGVLPGRTGGIAVALITGDRSGLSEETVDALRHSGLAHILAISGLHMAMIAGAIYWMLRCCLALFPTLALRFPIKKIAAIVALLGGFYYLLLSGTAIATQRAFIMVAVMFLAILLDRPAITLRNVAMAAMIILIIKPYSVLDVGFQMSFAAVIGLIAFYERAAQIRYKKQLEGPQPGTLPSKDHLPHLSYTVSLFHSLWTYIAGIIITTLVASLAVAPFAIFHFHQYSQYGLLGNLLAIPVVGLIVMPMALLTLLLIPFGLEVLPLTFMSWGLSLLLEAATMVSNLPGAVKYFPQIPTSAIACMALGGLWLAIWQNRWRYWGLFGIALGLALSPLYTFPDILVEREGKVIAIKQPNGHLAALPGRTGTFSLKQWLKIYGQPGPIKYVRNKKLFVCDDHACLSKINTRTVSYIKHPAAFSEDCSKADIIISTLPHHGQCGASPLIIDSKSLKQNGAYSIYIDGDTLKVKTVKQILGERPWVIQKPRAIEKPVFLQYKRR